MYGDQDPLRFMFSQDLGVNETVNIVLEGISHGDYFYDPELYNELQGLRDLSVTTFDNAAILNKIDALEIQIEKSLYADAFMARLAAASSNDIRWQAFLTDLPDPINGVYTVNPKDFVANLSTLLQNKGVSL